jgi:hypothetical protein
MIFRVLAGFCHKFRVLFQELLQCGRVNAPDCSNCVVKFCAHVHALSGIVVMPLTVRGLGPGFARLCIEKSAR